MLISVTLLNTGAVILFDFPKRLTNVCGHYSHLLNCLMIDCGSSVFLGLREDKSASEFFRDQVFTAIS
jgi:hypothetical protein